MHVGIIAACLPTMKPLFANFFGQVRSIATRGRTGGSTGLNSTPFRSKGYVKQSEQHTENSFVMKNMSDGSSHSTSRDPYAEDVVLGKDTYTVQARRGELDPSGIESRARESDESIESFHVGCAKRKTVPRGLTIIKTTEVAISR